MLTTFYFTLASNVKSHKLKNKFLSIKSQSFFFVLIGFLCLKIYSTQPTSACTSHMLIIICRKKLPLPHTYLDFFVFIWCTFFTYVHLYLHTDVKIMFSLSKHLASKGNTQCMHKLFYKHQLGMDVRMYVCTFYVKDFAVVFLIILYIYPVTLLLLLFIFLFFCQFSFFLCFCVFIFIFNKTPTESDKI